MVDERLRERQLLSEAEIKAVAREIAQAIAEKMVSGVKSDVRTEEQIKAIAERVAVEKLTAAGIKADKEHIEETRDTLLALQRNHKRRAEMSNDFVREMKALAGYSVAGLVGIAGTYIVLKGGSH